MMLKVVASDSEAAIWERLIQSREKNLPPEVARFFLSLKFGESDLNQMHALAAKNQEGLLSEEEEAQLRAYRRVGLQLDLLQAKARLALEDLADGCQMAP
jgi:hypothetical protein